MNTEVDDLIYFCTLFHNEKRDKEALESIKQLIDLNPCFDKVRRVLFQAIYKQIIDSIRSSLLTITSYYSSNLEHGNSAKADMLLQKKEDLINKLLPLCKEAIGLIDDTLLPNTENIQTIVYFQKFKGDLYRYIAEYSDDTDSIAAANSGEDCYREALNTASQNLSKKDPVYLSLVLNAAVFRYEIRKEKDLATEMLTNTIQEVQECQADLSQESASETENVIIIMRQNLQLWEDADAE